MQINSLTKLARRKLLEKITLYLPLLLLGMIVMLLLLLLLKLILLLDLHLNLLLSPDQMLVASESSLGHGGRIFRVAHLAPFEWFPFPVRSLLSPLSNNGLCIGTQVQSQFNLDVVAQLVSVSPY